MRQIFLDTETTGLNPLQGDRMVEFACVEMCNRRLTGARLHHYLNPQRKCSPEAFRVHGLSDAFLADKPLFGDVAQELVEFVKGAELIIHNAVFDLGFLDAELRACQLGAMDEWVSQVTDTLVLARELYPGKSNSLDALCKRLEVNNLHRTLHGALLDAQLLAEVYICMTRGQRVLQMGEAAQSVGAHHDYPLIDTSDLQLKVYPLSEQDRLAHEQLLCDIDKVSGGFCLWRKVLA